MTMVFQQIIMEMVGKPRRLFLIDGLGALLSAFLLGFVLVQLESHFGMPRKTLYFLAFLPCIFAAYDFTCYLRIRKNWSPYLRIIAIANLGYCLLSMGFLFHHYHQLTSLGLIYFLLEFAIVLLLVYIELKVATQLADGKSA